MHLEESGFGYDRSCCVVNEELDRTNPLVDPTFAVSCRSFAFESHKDGLTVCVSDRECKFGDNKMISPRRQQHISVENIGRLSAIHQPELRRRVLEEDQAASSARGDV